MKAITVLLADDHNLVRAGLRALLLNYDGVRVVGEASDGRMAVELVERHNPDIALMDLSMPDMNGIEATRRISQTHNRTKVIVLSMHANEEYVLEALRAGASAYLLKEAAPRELELAIDAVTKGQRFLSPAISKNVIEDYLARTRGGNTPIETLTPRQREIIQLIAEGRSTKEIAHLLSISVKTVETHRAQVMQRLGIHDIAGLVRYAVRKGWVSV